MPLRGCSCSGGLWATALVAFLALPVQYYVPDFSRSKKELSTDPLLTRPIPSYTEYFLSVSLENLPPFDLFLTMSLLMLAIVTYLCDWIQRKLMERRIIKLNQSLNESVERLRARDAREERLESALRMVQNATSEYNLLLYLLLRQHRELGPRKAPPSHCYFDKEFDDLDLIRNPTIPSTMG